MFAIGDKEWPGLSKLVEEMGEVQQVIGKLMATHGETAHLDGWLNEDLQTRLEDELADLKAALDFVVGMNKLDGDRIAKRTAEKFGRFLEWHHAHEHDNTSDEAPLTFDARCRRAFRKLHERDRLPHTEPEKLQFQRQVYPYVVYWRFSANDGSTWETNAPWRQGSWCTEVDVPTDPEIALADIERYLGLT